MSERYETIVTDLITKGKMKIRKNTYSMIITRPQDTPRNLASRSLVILNSSKRRKKSKKST